MSVEQPEPIAYTPFDADPDPEAPPPGTFDGPELLGDAGGGDAFPSTEVRGPAFRFDGRGLSADEFSDLIDTYSFGSTLPDYIVLHHTAVPTATWCASASALARMSPWQIWDYGEAGLDAATIKARRHQKLLALRDYYRDSPELRWDRGPHLFIDDRYIWLFSQMDDYGIHATWGNWFRDVRGRHHYSIGIEVIGDYAQVRWPEPVARLVGHAVAVLQRRLKTFELRYMYAGISHPNRGQRTLSPQNRALTQFGGVASHRDYNKPQCPGAMITEEFYIDVLRAGRARLERQPLAPPLQPPPRVIGPALTIVGAPSGERGALAAYIKEQIRRPLGAAAAYTDQDIDLILSYYWMYAVSVGVDPFLAAAQCVFETDALSSEAAQRPRRNPAGLRDAGGRLLSFGSWEEAVQAHLGRLLALACTDAAATPVQRAMMLKFPTLPAIPASLRGAAPTVADLSGRWQSDPAYATKLLTRMRAITGDPAILPPPPRVIGPALTIVGGASGAQAAVSTYIKQRMRPNPGAKPPYSANDVDIILLYYWTYGPPVGVDPFLAACQCVFETDALSSDAAQRPRRNPAGLRDAAGGLLSFPDWEQAVHAHLGRLLALALRDDQASAPQRTMMQTFPALASIPANQRGAAPTLADLSGRWQRDPSYADKLIARMREVAGI